MFTSVDDLRTNRELGGFLRRLAEGDERIAASMREGGARVRIGPACVARGGDGESESDSESDGESEMAWSSTSRCSSG